MALATMRASSGRYSGSDSSAPASSGARVMAGVSRTAAPTRSCSSRARGGRARVSITITDENRGLPAAPRSTLVIGKALSSSIRGLSQAIVIYLCAAAMGVHLSFAPWCIALVVLFIALGSGLFSTFSLIIACIVKTRERFMGVGQVLTMPLFFASNAIYPLSLMPGWLRAVARANPLTYLVDALRMLMIEGGQGAHSLAMNFAVLGGVFVVFVVIAARLYPTLIE